MEISYIGRSSKYKKFQITEMAITIEFSNPTVNIYLDNIIYKYITLNYMKNLYIKILIITDDYCLLVHLYRIT